jgi:hypothetical protein
MAVQGSLGGAQRVAVAKHFELTLKSSGQVDKAPKSIEVTLVLRNVSSSTVEITETIPSQDFSFIVKTSDNRDVPKTDLGRRLEGEPWRGDRRVPKEFSPGESAQYEVDLGMLYQLNTPGSYTVRAIRVLTSRSPAVANERIVSNPLTIRVE